MELVAYLGEGKETWGQVAGVINHGDWENIILLGTSSGREFASKKEFEFIEVTNISITELKNEMLDKLKNKIKSTEVGLSIASGEGKEHMALISALLSIPVGIRFAVLTKDGLIFM